MGRPSKYKATKEFENKVKHYFDSITITYQVFDSKKVGVDDRGEPILEQTPRISNAGEPIFRNEYQENPSILSLCRHLDITRETLSQYEKMELFSDTIKKAKAKIEEYLENQLYRDSQVTGIIFNLKNNFKWQDKQELDLSVKEMPEIVIKRAE